MDPVTIGLIASSAISAGASGAQMMAQKGGTKLQFKRNKALQAQAAKLNYDYSIKSAQNYSSAYREGLEKAGFNPMLAVHNGTSGANSSWTSSQSVSAPDYGSAISSGVSNVADFMRLRNETAQSESVVKLNEAQSRKNISEAINNEIKNSFLDERERTELGKIRGETAKLQSDINYNSAYLEYLNQSLEIQDKLGMMGIDVQKRGQNINNATDLIKSVGAGALGVYGLGKLKLIKPVGDLIKVVPKYIKMP